MERIMITSSRRAVARAQSFLFNNSVRGLSTYTSTPGRFAGAPSTADNVGIVATEIYFPTRYVDQRSMEEHDGMSPGKYTIGLGQEKMAVAGVQEDINSMCMSAISSLFDKYGLDAKDIGFLGVGTETLVDKSKSTKTALMNELFGDNTDVEGVTTINACYGGTASLFNAVDWVESSAWDGRYAIVLAGDIAVYEAGPARPTGGAGVVAMLIGPNAPLVMERGLRASHFEDVWDFYKPTMNSEYPRVDGKLSNSCYIRAIDTCYRRYAQKYERIYGESFDVSKADHSVFHLPYTKLVQKSFARLKYNDYLMNPEGSGLDPVLGDFRNLEAEESYVNRDLEKALVKLSKDEYDQKVFPSTFGGRNLGNLYAGSLYAGLVSLIAAHGDNLMGQRIQMFSYGSGLAASMFSLKCEGSVEEQRAAVNFHERLENRQEVSAEEFNAILGDREDSFTKYGFAYDSVCESIPAGAYRLTKVDDKERRFYEKVVDSKFATASSSNKAETATKPTTPTAAFA